jgi:hypothetical protein
MSSQIVDLPIKQNHISERQIQKYKFIENALENGWSIKKRKDAYIFFKKHEGKKEVYTDTYLDDFILKNLQT